MHIQSLTIGAAFLALNLNAVLAVPVPQANKIGGRFLSRLYNYCPKAKQMSLAGASDILTGFDNGSGYFVQNACASIQSTEQGVPALGNFRKRSPQANKIGGKSLFRLSTLFPR